MSDHSFDGLSEKFAQNIYATSKGKIRTAVVWRDLEQGLARFGNQRVRILDAGGGFGFFAQKLAALGHDVTLCDLSADMLELAKEQIVAKGLTERIRLVHCAIQDLPEHVDGTFDFVLCHAVVEWLADPKSTLMGLLHYLKPGGLFSLLFYNRDALLFQSLVVGNFDYIRAGLVKKRQQKLTPTNPQTPADVYQWLAEWQMPVLCRSGVRVIHDYMRHKEDQHKKFSDLLEMELRYCQQEPFVHLGRYMHVLASKPCQ
jgi:S-adenosylmethionine-dependent methyltransferase